MSISSPEQFSSTVSTRAELHDRIVDLDEQLATAGWVVGEIVCGELLELQDQIKSLESKEG